MIGLAIVFILTISMFLYFRQKMAYYEVRLSLLSDTVQTMAGITRLSLHESDSESDESECESECESENDPKIINLNSFSEPEITIELTKIEPDLSTEELIVVSDDEAKPVEVPDTIEVTEIDITETKKIELPTEFDNLTVKELKEKVAELNGPKLKTKKELIQFLQNKI